MARLLTRGAGLLLVGSLVTACSSSESSSAESTPGVTAPTTPTSTDSPSPSATATAPATVPTTAPATPAPVPPDGPTLLQQAFDQAASGYHFVTTATVNGAVESAAEGDQIGTGTRLTVTVQNATLGYIILPEGSWILEGDSWKELDDPPPVSDPISSLRAPLSVTVTAFTPTSATLLASYPAAALALEGDQPVDVTFEIEGTMLRSITYVAPSAIPASVRADISPLVDTSPVVDPTV